MPFLELMIRLRPQSAHSKFVTGRIPSCTKSSSTEPETLFFRKSAALLVEFEAESYISLWLFFIWDVKRLMFCSNESVTVYVSGRFLSSTLQPGTICICTVFYPSAFPLWHYVLHFGTALSSISMHTIPNSFYDTKHKFSSGKVVSPNPKTMKNAQNCIHNIHWMTNNTILNQYKMSMLINTRSIKSIFIKKEMLSKMSLADWPMLNSSEV